MLLATAGVVVAVGVGVILFQALGRPVVQVTSVVRSEVVQAFYATGTIVPEREYAVKSQVAGVLVLEPGIDKGVAVKRGQLLGRIVSDDLEKKLKQAEAGLKERRARADEKSSPVLNEFDRRIEAYEEIVASAKREHTRLVDLGATGNAQPVEIDRAFERARTMWAELEGFKAQRRAKALEVARELEVAEATYNIAKWNVEQQELHAPVDGVILDWPVPTRTRMKIDEHVMLIADVRPERLVMRAQVDEEDRNKLVVGQVVNMTLYSFGTEPIVGRVKTVYAKADPQRRTFEVDVELGAPGGTTRPLGEPLASATGSGTSVPLSTTNPTSPYARFAPGMTGELAFVEQHKKDVMILPRQALQGDAFYVVRNGKVARVAAKAGVRSVDRVEVLGAIAADDKVILSPIGPLKEGDAVKTDFVDNRTAADANKPKDAEIFKGGF
ncbi:MAG TPA: efflux RND transporter periplasmic adaptor subunit [Tepidisphaeraceae bacterium]|nr:efflux RND transporter periplasmic adaptor subunit [Tepidisphaeraceae bacterium]